MNSFFNISVRSAFTLLAGVFAVFRGSEIQAQTDTSFNKTKQLEEVVVTGQFGETSLTNSVYKIRIIDAKKITSIGANNLSDLLKQEMNIRISQDPILGSNISIQGVGGQNIKFLKDGIPVVGRENGNIDLTQILLNNIERIEIVEGPMSVIYGTDALGGVINLITKKNFSSPLQAGVNTFYETIGNYNASAFVNSNIKTWNFSLSGGRNYFEGWNPDPNTRFKLWKPREQYFADLSIGKNFNRSSVRLNGSWMNEKITNRDSGTITPYYAYALDQYYYTQRITSSLFYDLKINKNTNLNFVESFSDYRRINNSVRKDLVTLQEQLVPDPSQQDTTHYNEWLSRATVSNKNKGFNVLAGYEFIYDDISGNQIRNNYQSIWDGSVFGSAELKWKRLLIRPGLRFTHNSQFNAPPIPSLNLKYLLNEKISVRASYGKGFRAPTLKEMYLSFVDPTHNVQGNPALKAESGDNFQLGIQYEEKFPERVFRFEPSVFYNHITNMIDLAILNSTSSSTAVSAEYFNIDAFKSIGANLNMEYRAPHYSLILGYSYTGKSNSLMDLTSVNEFFYTHEFRINYNYEFKKPELSFSVFYKYNGRFQNYQFDYVANKVNLGYIDPYSLLDASCGKYFFHRSLKLTMGVRNILNVVNVAASLSAGIHSSGTNVAQAAMGRSLFVGLQYTFGKNR
ncbi:MAG: TonB-dependent receptor plug domain-containing protein [Bacteroidia bacterium]